MTPPGGPRRAMAMLLAARSRWCAAPSRCSCAACEAQAPACHARMESLGASSIQTLSVRLSRMTISGTSSSASDDQHRCPDGQLARGEEAQGHHADVAQIVEDAVARVTERDGRLAVAVDDRRGVLGDFPGGLDRRARRGSAARRSSSAPQGAARRRRGSRGRCGWGCTSRRASGSGAGRRCPTMSLRRSCRSAGGPWPAGCRRRRG